MRQTKFKPRSKSNSVYWTRMAKRGNKKESEAIQEFNPMDLDHDGYVSSWEIKAYVITYILSIVLGIIGMLFLFYLAYLGS